MKASLTTLAALLAAGGASIAIAAAPIALAEPPLIPACEVEEAGGEEEYEGYRPMAAEIATIQSRIEELERQVESVGILHKYTAGMYAGKIEGIMIGLVIALGILGLLAGGV